MIRFLVNSAWYEELDNEVAKIDVTRTPAYHELGRQAVALKKSLGHGGWGPYLRRINRSQRTINRAMTIFIAFPDKSKSAKWIALSLIDAEEEARNVVAKNTGKARTTRKPKSSEGQGTPKETPVVLDKSKSLEPKVNVQQEVVGSLADQHDDCRVWQRRSEASRTTCGGKSRCAGCSRKWAKQTKHGSVSKRKWHAR